MDLVSFVFRLLVLTNSSSNQFQVAMSIFPFFTLTFALTVCIPSCDMVSTKGAELSPLVHASVPVWALHASDKFNPLLNTTPLQWFDGQTRSCGRACELSDTNSSTAKTKYKSIGFTWKSSLLSPDQFKEKHVHFAFANGYECVAASQHVKDAKSSELTASMHAVCAALHARITSVAAYATVHASSALASALRVCVWILLCTGAFAVARDVATALVGFAIWTWLLAPRSTKGLIYMLVRCMYMCCSGSLSQRLDKVLIMQACVLIYSMCLPMAEAVGRETPKLTMHKYFLPGVNTWDSFPFHDFRLVWFTALCAALGNINQEGWTLLQTARDQDIGAPGNPGTPAQGVQSQNRNQRLFGAILNYIEATSYLYQYVSNTFANDGRALFEYIWVVGHLDYTNEERIKLENEWTDATMSSVGIEFEPNAVFKWCNWVDLCARKLNKTEAAKRAKYLQGFPSSFNVMVVPERGRGAVGSYTHPAVYPAHHPQAGVAHPNAGEPDIQATARAFYPEWARMLSGGQIKRVPKGFANRMQHDRRSASNKWGNLPLRPPRERGYQSTASASDESDHDESGMIAREACTPRMVCFICGGIGHAGQVGNLKCLTAHLGYKIPRSDLSQITYPKGYSAPRSDRFDKTPRPLERKARAIEDEPDEDDNEAMRFEKYKGKSTNPRRITVRSSRPRPKPRARKTDTANEATPQAEPPQNSADAAAESHESDIDEEGLAVSFDLTEY